MKTLLLTAIYANLYGTDLGGRTCRHHWYKWSLLSILKVKPSKVVCFTSAEEIEDLKRWFYDEQGVDKELLEFKVYDLRQSKFYNKIQLNKNIESIKTGDRCVEIQYNKFFWYDLLEDVYEYDRLYWIDAGLSHNGLFPQQFKIGDKWESDFTFNIFKPELLDKWNKDTEEGILILAKNNTGRYYWSTTLPDKYYDKYETSHHIIGGMFGGTPKNYKRFARDFERQLWQLLVDEDVLYMEENIMTCMYFNNPNNFNIYTFDDWYEREEWAEQGVDPKLFYQMFINE